MAARPRPHRVRPRATVLRCRSRPRRAGTSPNVNVAAIAAAAENASTRQSSVKPHRAHVSGTAFPETQCRHGKRESGDGAEAGEHQALGEELVDESARPAPSAARTATSRRRTSPRDNHQISRG